MSYQIGGGGFRFREAVLMRANFKFQIMRDMIMNHKFEYFRKVVEEGYWSVIANRGTFAFFENRNNCCLLP
jgi:hypothetical protein